MKIYCTHRLLPLLTIGTLFTAFAPLQAQDASPSPAARPNKAMHHDWDGHHGMGDPMDFLTKRLNLTSDQQAQIKPIVEATLPVFTRIHEEEKAKMEGAMMVAVSEVKEKLNPDQKMELERLVTMMHEHEQDGMMHHEHHDEPKPDGPAPVAPAK